MRFLGWLAIVLLPTVLALGFFLAWQYVTQADYTRSCVEAGGHLYDQNGVRLCLSQGGTIVELPR